MTSTLDDLPQSFTILRHDIMHQVSVLGSNFGLIIWHGVSVHFPIFDTSFMPGMVPAIFLGRYFDHGHFYLGALQLRHLAVAVAF